MLSKAKYPQLNRKARRHPKQLQRQLAQAAGSGALMSNWLLAGLFLRGNVVGPDNITMGRDLTKAQAIAVTRATGKPVGFLARAIDKFKEILS